MSYHIDKYRSMCLHVDFHLVSKYRQTKCALRQWRHCTSTLPQLDYAFKQLRSDIKDWLGNVIVIYDL